jgi:hypothetical protein
MKLKNVSIIVILVSLLLCGSLAGCSTGNIKSSVQLTGTKWLNPSMKPLADRTIQPRESEESTSDKPEAKFAKEPELKINQPLFENLIFWANNNGWVSVWGADKEDDQQEYARAVARDTRGGIYVTGNFANGAEFSGGQDPYGYDINSRGESDIFLSKYNAQGEFQWATGIGGEGTDGGKAIATDSEDCVLITGSFEGEFDFNPHVSHYDPHSAINGSDIFLIKYDKLGRQIWARTWGGYMKDEHGLGVATDGSDNIYVTGYYGMTVDFDPGPGVENHTASGSADVFISKFNPMGQFQWVRTFASSSTAVGFGIAADKAGNVYAVGYFYGIQYDLSAGQKPGGYLASSNGNADAFLTKFNTDGGFEWARSWGGDESDYAYDVALTDDGSTAYVCGHFSSTVEFPSSLVRGGITTYTANGARDAYLCKINSNGSFKWARAFGGTERDQCLSIAVDGRDDIYTTGFYSETVDFNPKASAVIHTSNGLHDSFLAKYTPNGTLLWAHTWGAGMYDEAFGVAADPLGAAYVTGIFGSTVNFATAGFNTHIAEKVRDIFLCSFPSDGEWGDKLQIKPEFVELKP